MAGRKPKDKAYVLEERKKIILERLALGYSQVDVAMMVGLDPSAVSHLVSGQKDEYQNKAALETNE